MFFSGTIKALFRYLVNKILISLTWKESFTLSPLKEGGAFLFKDTHNLLRSIHASIYYKFSAWDIDRARDMVHSSIKNDSIYS
jgi:hypothetical protein